MRPNGPNRPRIAPEFPSDPRQQARTQASRHPSGIWVEYAPNGLDQPGFSVENTRLSEQLHPFTIAYDTYTCIWRARRDFLMLAAPPNRELFGRKLPFRFQVDAG